MSTVTDSPSLPPGLTALIPVIEGNAHAIVLISVAGEIVGWSPGAQDLWGYDLDEVCHQPVRMLSPPDRAGPASGEVVREMVRQQRSIRLQTEGQRKDGASLELSLSLTPVLAAGGVLEGICGIAVETSTVLQDSEHLRGSERLFRLLAEQARDVVYRLRLVPDLAYEYVSPSLETMTGFTPEQFREDADLPMRRVHPEDRPAVLRTRDEPDRVGEAVPFRSRRADGEWIWLEEAMTPIKDEDGTVIALEGIVRDVTVRQQAAAALQAALERERRALHELLAFERRRNTFVNAVSHELRTPLTAILGFASVMVARIDQLTTPQLQVFTVKVLDNARRLEHLVEDVMDLVGRDPDQPDPAMVTLDLAEVVEGELATWPSGGRPVAVSLACVLVIGHRARLERLTRALLDNLVRHTDPDTPVRIDVREVDGEARLVVEDAGDGWCESVREIALEAFTWGEHSGRAPSPGLGIGLALVANHARIHGGRAMACDGESGGARVEVWLPLAPGPVGGPTSDPEHGV